MSYEHILIEAEDGVGIVTLRWRRRIRTADSAREEISASHWSSTELV